MAHESGRIRLVAADTVALAAVWCATALSLGAFAWLVADMLVGGAARLSWAFLTDDPLDAGRAGGIAPVLVSTALVLLVCLVAAVPLGLGAGVLLSEATRSRRRLAAGVRACLDVLAAVPSIVFGLFGSAFFCEILGLGYSILAGGLTLACMVLPILVRSIEAALRTVPDAWRRAGAALALSRPRLLCHVLLPAAAPGLVGGLMLGVARALAETAALLFTSGYVDRMPGSLLDSGRVLSIHILDLTMNVPGGEPNAYAAGLVLLLTLLVVDLAAFALVDRLLRRRFSRS